MHKLDDILSSRRKFCSFVDDLSRHGLTNMNGSAYRSHPKCHWEDGILLVDQHHVDDYCDIRIASDRSANCRRGCTNSAANGNAYPSLDKGEWVRVWVDGKWKKTGPWCDKIRSLIDILIIRLEQKKEQLKRKKEQKEEEERLKLAEKEKKLIEEWQ